MEVHKRLGHASKEAVINTLNNTYGIACTDKDFEDFFCATCAISNSKRKGISMERNPDLRATKKGERIYCDLKTFKAPSHGGYKHYIVFVDEFTDWMTIFGLKNKGGAYKTLQSLVTEMGLNKVDYQTILRPDGDPSCFDNVAFKGECDRLGIRLDFTPPYTPQHNKAERAIEAIDFKARVSLVDAPHMDFNTHYFHASSSAVYLHNRMVGTRGKTPFELMFDLQPMISQIMPFGCRGVAHIPKESGRREQHRGEEVCLVGYRSPTSNQWRV